jgi:methylmalonyl-CoA carboxyltransferase large subunit
MSDMTIQSLRERLEALKAQVTALSEKLAEYEAASARAQPAPVEEAEEISEELLLAISAAVAAYLGVRARVRHVRLIGSTAWAQQGRVSIQASHRLH